MSDVDIQDGAQDFRIMKRQVVEAILSMPEYNRFPRGFLAGLASALSGLSMKTASGQRAQASGRLQSFFAMRWMGLSAFPLRL